MGASDKQIGGEHYKNKGTCLHCGNPVDHWDLVEMFGLDPFQYVISKYLFRWRDKAGLQDIDKMAHFVERYRELAEREINGVTDALEEELDQEMQGAVALREGLFGVLFLDEPDAEPLRSEEAPLPRHILLIALEAALAAMQAEAEAPDEAGDAGPGYVGQDPDLRPPRRSEETAREDLGADSLPAIDPCPQCGCRCCRCGDGNLSMS